MPRGGDEGHEAHLGGRKLERKQILTPIPPNTAPFLAVSKYGESIAKSQMKGSKTVKKKPPFHHGNGG